MADLLISFHLTLEVPLSKRHICTAERFRVKMYKEKKENEIAVATLLDC
jgi:hypothetical protein